LFAPINPTQGSKRKNNLIATILLCAKQTPNNSFSKIKRTSLAASNCNLLTVLLKNTLQMEKQTKTFITLLMAMTEKVTALEGYFYGPCHPGEHSTSAFHDIKCFCRSQGAIHFGFAAPSSRHWFMESSSATFASQLLRKTVFN